MLRRNVILVVCLIFPLLVQAAGFAVTDTAGKVHTLEGHRGKWVLVNLWATWCAPCLTEMPELEALARSNPDLVVLGIAIDGQDGRRVTGLAAKLGVTYPTVAGNQVLVNQFKARGVPTSILFDPSGKQVLVKEGPVTMKEIAEVIRR